jgi:hypothetical protein
MQSLPHKLSKLDIYHWDNMEWEDEGVMSFLERRRVRVVDLDLGADSDLGVDSDSDLGADSDA